MKKTIKSTIISICLIIVVIVLVNMCNNNQRSEKQATSKSQEVVQVKTPEELQAEEELRQEQQRQEQERRAQQAIEDQKKRFAAELKLLDEPFDVTGYTAGDLNYVVKRMKARVNMIQEGEKSDVIEIQELAKKLKTKAVAYQIKAFPIMRKTYAAGLNQELWGVDGKAYVSGNNNIYITVVSPELVRNKMKLEAHKTIYSTLNNLRFRQARYKWYDGSDYTYWNVYEGKDADLLE